MAILFADIATGATGKTGKVEAAERFEGFRGGQGFVGFLFWLFPLMLATATILAVLVLIYAGFKWMAGAISPPQVEDAKNWIWAAITGLAIALFSYLILKTINPDLLTPNPKGTMIEKSLS